MAGQMLKFISFIHEQGVHAKLTSRQTRNDLPLHFHSLGDLLIRVIIDIYSSSVLSSVLNVDLSIA